MCVRCLLISIQVPSWLSARTELYCVIQSYGDKDEFQIYRRRRQISGEIYILIIMADCVSNRRAELAPRRNEERRGWRRQDATEVWYFAEKSSHCLKVDGVTPRRKITSGAASINSLLYPTPPFAQPPLSARSEGNSSSIILVLVLPSPLLFPSRSFLHALTARCHHPVHPPVPSQNLFRIQPLSSFIPSVTQFWRTTSLWNYERQSGIHLHSWKTYIYIYISFARLRMHADVIASLFFRYLRPIFIIYFSQDKLMRVLMFFIPRDLSTESVHENRGSANPINQNILKLGPPLGPLPFFSSRLHPFNKLSPGAKGAI